MRLPLVMGVCALLLWVAPAAHAASTTTDTFTTPGTFTWTVPAGVTSTTFELDGAQGGGTSGGKGATLVATLAVTPGQAYTITVGGQDGTGGGGTGGNSGGGASWLQLAGTNLLVAGGGGGQGGTGGGGGGAGGAGGVSDGDGTNAGSLAGFIGTISGGSAGKGGTAGGGGGLGGGSATAGTDGSGATGGAGGAGQTIGGTGGDGGGGGGGYTGGGGGGGGAAGITFTGGVLCIPTCIASVGAGGGGGGGGSSYSAPSASAVTLTQAARSGDGQVVISYTTVTTSAPSAPSGGSTSTPPPVPTLLGISVPSGPAGTVLKITGPDLGGVTQVLFGNTPALFIVDGFGSLTALVPPGTGTVGVKLVGAGGSSAPAQFTYTGPAGATQPSGTATTTSKPRPQVCAHMPSLLRHTYRGAKAAMAMAGCNVVLHHIGHAAHGRSHVKQQSPAPGTPVLAGDPVSIVLG